METCCTSNLKMCTICLSGAITVNTPMRCWKSSVIVEHLILSIKEHPGTLKARESLTRCGWTDTFLPLSKQEVGTYLLAGTSAAQGMEVKAAGLAIQKKQLQDYDIEDTKRIPFASDTLRPDPIIAIVSFSKTGCFFSCSYAMAD